MLKRNLLINLQNTSGLVYLKHIYKCFPDILFYDLCNYIGIIFMCLKVTTYLPIQNSKHVVEM